MRRYNSCAGPCPTGLSQSRAPLPDPEPDLRQAADLGESGVATLLVGAHHGLFGTQMETRVDACYLADGVVMLGYYETDGEVRLAISVV